jgi:hypothetical protein
VSGVAISILLWYKGSAGAAVQGALGKEMCAQLANAAILARVSNESNKKQTSGCKLSQKLLTLKEALNMPLADIMMQPG